MIELYYEARRIAANIARLPVFIPQVTRIALSARADMICANHLAGGAVANESKYPYIVELVVADDKLDLEVSRRIMDFHRLRKIQVRHGLRIVTERQIYFRWCFSDLGTAEAFIEQFGGEVLLPEKPRRRAR